MLVFHLISSIAAKSDSSLYIKLTFDIVLYLGTYAGASLSICSSHKNVLWKFPPLIYCILEDLDVNQHVSFHIQYRKSSYISFHFVHFDFFKFDDRLLISK